VVLVQSIYVDLLSTKRNLNIRQRKSLGMKEFFSKSRDDFQKINPSDLLHTMNKNLLYLTYQIDGLNKLCKSMSHDMNNQKTVDDFYNRQEEGEESSP